ncbi:hypothetical protein VE25_05150 [Devosia geojensis]|uniref:Uncharacterized protein n=1 Tax=Devosia geojensis TaxID=443610 RepID=A0A0F5FVG6_9HYPH|nr:hypothetical protein [Devosia geojensis]KKB12828.1 hypothetical protein VE25_05150 [Devosia geojensis]
MTTRQEEDFKVVLATLIDDLHKAGTKDAEAMLHVGGIASNLCGQIKARSWSEAKRRMTPADHDLLRREFAEAGTRHHREGRLVQAYAVQALGTSLVAATRSSPEVRQGEQLLDEVIDRALALYRRTRKKSA